ncbi:MAG: hypothetical protein ACLS28_08290 [Clostridium neonatale]
MELLKNELKRRIERIICGELVSKVCNNSSNNGMEVVEKWGCMPGSDGYKEAERIFGTKYKLIEFSQLKKEILITWYNEFLYQERIKAKKEYSIQFNDNTKLYNSVKNNVINENVDRKLTGIHSDFIDNFNENSSIIEDIEGLFSIVKESAEDKINKPIGLNEVDKAIFGFDEINNKKNKLLDSKIEAIQELISKINKNNNSISNKRNNVYENYIVTEEIQRRVYLYDILEYIAKNEDYYYNIFFKMTHNTVSSNKFENDEINSELEKILERYLLEREVNLKRKEEGEGRNKTSKSILEKAFNDELKGIKSKCAYLSDNYVAFEVMYEECKQDNICDEIIQYYNVERRYNLRLYKEIIYDIINYKGMKKYHYEELIRRVAKVTILDNCMYRHLYIKEILKNLAFEIEQGKDNYYNNLINELEDIIGLKISIVKDMLDTETLSHKKICTEELKEDLKEAIIKILNIKKEDLEDLRNIDLLEGFKIENKEKTENINIEDDKEISKDIFNTLYKLLEYTKENFKEGYEYINL